MIQVEELHAGIRHLRDVNPTPPVDTYLLLCDQTQADHARQIINTAALPIRVTSFDYQFSTYLNANRWFLTFDTHPEVTA